ncbi:MAG: 6-phosphogluconolactonase [Rubrobacteraceae bacterium]|jgi:6-phosphogluconolactonase|nr:6-phosphogluconolactonase [Rubrobacter sp.]
MNVSVFENPEELAEAAARDFSEKAEAAISARGVFNFVLAGGSTPKATYEVLARDHTESVDWKNIHIFIGDERTVPPDHEDSNFRMAREALLDRVPVGSVHRMRGELAPEEAAKEYESELRNIFGEAPSFDLIHLGIGEDGHTASLFPRTEALEVTDRLVVSNVVEKLDTVRLTLTKEVINDARSVVFLVAGEGKAEALEEILEGGGDAREYPSKLIRPKAGGPEWMVERGAAGSLEKQKPRREPSPALIWERANRK